MHAHDAVSRMSTIDTFAGARLAFLLAGGIAPATGSAEGIATRHLVQMPATFWEKTKPAKVEEHDEVDE